MFTNLANRLAKNNSKNMAKERLKLVLIHDRSDVSPRFLEMIKSDIIGVITNYMDVDEESLDIQFRRTRSDEGDRIIPALIANIPIRKIKKSGI